MEQDTSLAGRRLALNFSAERMQAETLGIGPDEWVPHYETRDFEGDWSGVALRAIGGKAANLRTFPGAGPLYEFTPLLQRCPYFQEVLGHFQCPLNAVRLLRLAPGSRILPHRDDGLGQGREVRLHIPVQTDPLVEFCLDGKTLRMTAGECWYLDLSREHAIFNGWTDFRVHLVLDCVPNLWLNGLIGSANSSGGLP